MNKRLKVLLVGNPNVGKSALFNSMTGKYVTVSNYPGTTVEVTEGIAKVGDAEIEIIDTPGMYSMLPISEEEKVARDYIFFKNADCVINVVDVKNLERMLPLTFQLIETGIPVILVLNMMDEAKRTGVNVDPDELSKKLGIPVVPAISIKKVGVDRIFEHILDYKGGGAFRVRYDSDIEDAAKKIAELLTGKYRISKKLVGNMALQQDPQMLEEISKLESRDVAEKVDILRRSILEKLKVSIDYMLALNRQSTAREIVKDVVLSKGASERSLIVDFISRATVSSFWGYVILLLVLYVGLYKFVGEFGAGVLVDFIETELFENRLLPPVINLIETGIPYDMVKDLLIRDYGIITLGIKYAIAIVFPIVTTFFLFFSVLEDSGYLPRLALLLDRLFKRIGLTGRAVIPLVLGFGCDTMATMVTRTLSSNKERIIATVLLSLAIPCSAQLGVMLAVLSGSGNLLLIWVFILLLIFVLVGYLSNKLIKGDKTLFFVEVPPVRIPKLYNIFVKTYTRLVWYFKEVIPLFVYASILIWLGKLTGIFDILINFIASILKYLGLPREAAQVFLFGFFRRDYGAAGLYDMHKSGIFNNNQLLIIAVMLTLFLPCIAQLIMTIKERGIKTGIYIASFVFVCSIVVGFLLHLILDATGVSL